MADLYLSVPSDDAYWQGIFSNAVVSVDDWVYVAKALRLATESIGSRLKTVWEEIHSGQTRLSPDLMKLHPVFLMLSSYAAENYLKARIVVMKGWTAENIGKTLPKPLKSHELAELCKEAGASLTQEENDLIDRLSVYAVWAGRYPCPLAREELRPKMVGGKENMATFFRGSDISVAHCLLERFESLALSGAMPPLRREHKCYDEITIQERVTPW